MDGLRAKEQVILSHILVVEGKLFLVEVRVAIVMLFWVNPRLRPLMI